MTLRLTHAAVILERDIADTSLDIVDGKISLGAESRSDGPEMDCEGDFILPGLIDIHTDDLEHYAQPRPAVQWPSMLAAALAHDWQLLGSGITTVLDALALGDYDSGGRRSAMLEALIAGMTRAGEQNLLKVDHYFHFRCELSDDGLLPIVERHIGHPRARLVSLMDHTPGQRQWTNLDIYRAFRQKKNARVWTDEDFKAYVAERQARQARLGPAGRRAISRLSREHGITLASHDDTTVNDVLESQADGITISEFPTTVAAAGHARKSGMKIVMGSPNVILGGSHSGNVSARELARLDLLDALTSDYVPNSLLHAAFALAADGIYLPKAVAMVTATPADLIGLTDRGRIASGLRADLIRVRLVDGVPVIRNVWIGGRQYL